jgi:hypothetical protein
MAEAEYLAIYCCAGLPKEKYIGKSLRIQAGGEPFATVVAACRLCHMSISEFFEKQMELERMQREGGAPSVDSASAPLHGRRSAQGRARAGPAGAYADLAAPDEWSSPDAEDEQILMRFYRDIQPEFATPEKIQRIIQTFRKKAAKTGADWREWMYTDVAGKRGIDPRGYAPGQQPVQASFTASRPPGGQAAAGGFVGFGGAVQQQRAAPAEADWDQQLRLDKLAQVRPVPTLVPRDHCASVGEYPILTARVGGISQGSVQGGPGRFHAARSHELNTEYGGQWDSAYQEVRQQQKPTQPTTPTHAPVHIVCDNELCSHRFTRSLGARALPASTCCKGEGQGARGTTARAPLPAVQSR